MGGNVESIKERLDVAEVLGGYIKLEKAGANFKAKCPFHSEKTASFFISPARQSYYCFGCGAKGDIFTFVEEMEGTDFRGALKILADRAGVELKFERGESKSDKDKLYTVLEEATQFFEKELKKSKEALKYLEGRGVLDETIKSFRLGFVPDEWRALRGHLNSLGYADDVLTRAGLIKAKSAEGGSPDPQSGFREPYDTFRGRLIFPLFDPRGEVIAFSGRALAKDTEPKYLNSPDTPLFTKSEVLYGYDKAREEIRRKDYAVLVEGQLDLVLSHQAGVKNTVASSGTAFTLAHLDKLKKVSPRIILAFDGDQAGEKAAERSAALALSLGMEVKIAELPEGRDPADLVKEDGELWKEVLRSSKPAIEIFLDMVLKEEKDQRKAGKVIEKKILPLLALVQSAMERSHFVSMIAKRTGIREEVIVEDLRRVKVLDKPPVKVGDSQALPESKPKRTRQDELEEVKSWLEEDHENKDLLRQKEELERLIKIDEIDTELTTLRLNSVDDVRKMKLLKERDELRSNVL